MIIMDGARLRNLFAMAMYGALSAYHQKMSQRMYMRLIRTKVLFNVEVPTVNLRTIRGADVKGTRAGPGAIIGTEGAVEEVGKVLAVFLRGNEVVASSLIVDAANAKQNL